MILMLNRPEFIEATLAANRLGAIAVPESPSNLKFGGIDGKTLFITARTGAYIVEMKVRGDGFGK